MEDGGFGLLWQPPPAASTAAPAAAVAPAVVPTPWSPSAGPQRPRRHGEAAGVGVCGDGSAQEAWLRDVLILGPAGITAAEQCHQQESLKEDWEQSSGVWASHESWHLDWLE